MRHWRSFPLQLFVLVVLPLITLLLLITFGSITLHQQAMRAMVGERDERAIRAAAAAISEQLNHRSLAIRSLAAQVAATNDPEHALADAAFLLPDFEYGLAIYSIQGEWLASTTQPNIWQQWTVPERLAALENVALNEDVLFLPPFIDPSDGGNRLLVVAQERNYLVVGAIAPDRLAHEALTDLFGANDWSSAFISTSDGDLLYQAGLLPTMPQDIRQYPGVHEAIMGQSGTTRRFVGREEYVVAFTPIRSVEWALVVEEPWHTVADPLLRATEWSPVIGMLVLLVTLLVLWLGVRQIVQPLQALERKATQLGQGDFAAIAEPVGGIYEIQQLQNQLVQMAQKVKLAQQNLRGYLGAVTSGQEEERRRLARDLHDETMQSLIALNQQLQLAQLTVTDEHTTTPLNQMQQMATQIVADLRRLIHDLRPIYLEDLGLVPALNMLARDSGKNINIPVAFQLSGDVRRLPAAAELAFYRIAQEGLNNVARHAQASQAFVTLAFTDDSVTLMIQDDGVGFAIADTISEIATQGHFGLLGIQERAELIGAQASLSSSPNEGTKLSVFLPNPSQKNDDNLNGVHQ